VLFLIGLILEERAEEALPRTAWNVIALQRIATVAESGRPSGP